MKKTFYSLLTLCCVLALFMTSMTTSTISAEAQVVGTISCDGTQGHCFSIGTVNYVGRAKVTPKTPESIN